MSSFVANGSHYNTDIVINRGSFFPPVPLIRLRETLSIDGTVTDPQLKQIATEEILDLNRLLKTLKQQGSTLAELSEDFIDGIGDKEILYMTAVGHGVSAQLNERKRKYDSSGAGLNKAEDIELTIDSFRQKRQWAVQQLLGQNRTIVELI